MSALPSPANLHPNVVVGLPIGFIRSALFGVGDRPVDPILQLELASAKSVVIRYRGPALNQHHALLWQAILEAHRERCGNDPTQVLHISRPALLRAIGRNDVSTAARKQCNQWLDDLTRAWVSVETAKVRYCGALLGGALLNKETSLLSISIPGLLDLFTNEVAHIDFRRKLALGRNQLALWLHDFISSQSNDPTRMIPVPVTELRRLSGSSLKLPQFRQRLKQAIELLKAGKNGTLPLLIRATIDTGDRLVFEKSRTFTLILGGKAEVRVQATNNRDRRVQEVLESRGRVAL
ncbi:MAG: hypothetical protein RSP_04660 [Rhodanobacter sp.]